MKNKLITLILAAVLALPAMAQQFGTKEPDTQFQSTSGMTPSGSAYSSEPMLGADGTATYSSATAPAQPPVSGARKVGPPTPEGDPTPIGDGAWALVLIAGLYAAYIYRVKRGQAKE